jgi:hypothetical protein
MRREVPLVFTFLAALIMIVSFFVPHRIVSDFVDNFRNSLMVIAAFAVVLGIGNIIRVNMHVISSRGEAWKYKIILLVSLFVMAFFGLFFGISETPTYKLTNKSFQKLEQQGVAEETITQLQTMKGRTYNSEEEFLGVVQEQIGATGLEANRSVLLENVRLRNKVRVFFWMFQHLYVPMQAAMFSLLAFFIASAAYRAFRMRNTEAALLLISATIIMIGQVPIGQWLSDNLYLKIFGSDVIVWIMSVPNMAAKRAILIGAAFGGISQAIRIMLGIERTYLGGEQR